MSTEVQIEKDKEVIEETNELPFEVKGERDLERLFDEHPKFFEEFREIGAQKFLEKYGDSDTEEDPDKDTVSDSKPKTDQKVQDEDFLAEDEPDKSKKQDPKPADTPVSETDSKVERRLAELTDQLKAAQDKMAELEKGTSKQDDKKIKSELKKVDLSNLTDLPDDLDWYSAEGQEKAKKHLQELTKALKETVEYGNSYQHMSDELKKLREDVDSAKTKVDTVDSKVKETEAKGSFDDQITAEFKAIDAMVKSNKDVFGDKVRPVKAIEDDYLENLDRMLKDVAKTNAEKVVDGSFSKEALRCIELYNGTTDKAKRFQAKCKELDIALPEDLDVLNKVYEIRNIRNNELSLKDDANNIIKIPEYDVALQNYKGRHVNEFRIKERTEIKSAHDRAVLNRKSFAPETKASAVPGEGDISQLPVEEVNRVLNIMPKDRTPEERELAYKIFRHAKMEDKEARHLSGLDLKE